MGNYIDYGSCSHCRCLFVFAYMSYNQSIKNRNKTQVELIANSAIKSLAGAIENDENSSQLIPDTVNKLMYQRWNVLFLMEQFQILNLSKKRKFNYCITKS